MPVCLYLRGSPGTGKRTTADILERDLGWPVLWVHQFDAVYTAIGEYKVPRLTDGLIREVCRHLIAKGKSFIVVRPAREANSVRYNGSINDDFHFVAVRLTAPYPVLAQRVTRRWHESPFRITTREALDEYLSARPEEEFPGEYVIDTAALTPEQVAGRIKELLP